MMHQFIKFQASVPGPASDKKPVPEDVTFGACAVFGRPDGTAGQTRWFDLWVGVAELVGECDVYHVTGDGILNGLGGFGKQLCRLYGVTRHITRDCGNPWPWLVDLTELPGPEHIWHDNGGFDMGTRNAPNVLLVYPEIPNNTYWSFAYALRFISKQAAMPPLGLVTVAALLPPDWTCRLIDENVTPVGDDDLEWADLVFISAMMIQREGVARISRRAAERNRTVVVGGPYPAQFYEELTADVDHVIVGEAESGVLQAFVDDWMAGDPKSAYARHVTRRSGTEQQMDELEWQRLRKHFGKGGDLRRVDCHPSLDSSPCPRFELLDLSAYGSMALQLSRGCPFNCEFCSEPALFGNRPRLKTPGQILTELRYLYELGYRGSVFFVDDNFIGNIRDVSAVLNHVKAFQQERGYPFAFYTEASLNLAQSPPLMAAMRDAGFNMVFVGLETTDAATLAAANKHQNTGTDLLEDVTSIQQYGMEVTAGFIVGMDREPPDICDQIYAFCQAAGIPAVMVGLLTPLRGSRLHQRLTEEGRLIREPLSGSNTHFFGLNYTPDGGRDAEAIVDGYKKLLARLYAPDGTAYFQRCRTLLRNIGESPTFTRSVHTDEVFALLRSLAVQPLKPYRIAYARFFLTILKERFSVFPEAVRLAIIGHHFMRITTDALRVDRMKTALCQRMETIQEFLHSAKASGTGMGAQIRQFLRQQQKTVLRIERRARRLPAEYQDDVQDLLVRVLECLREVQQKSWQEQ